MITNKKYRLVKDLTGKVFHYLTVKEFVYSKNHHSHWLCVCKCGKEIIVAGHNLGRGTLSCSCHRRLEKNQALVHTIYFDYRNRAKKNGLEFCLNKDDFKKLILNECYYCKKSYSNCKKRQGNELMYNGIDRIDNTKGYILENVRTCCTMCNTMKMNYTEEEFKDHIEKLYKNYVLMGNVHRIVS